MEVFSEILKVPTKRKHHDTYRNRMPMVQNGSIGLGVYADITSGSPLPLKPLRIFQVDILAITIYAEMPLQQSENHNKCYILSVSQTGKSVHSRRMKFLNEQ